MPADSENESQTWIDAIHKKLQECIQDNKPGLLIAYGDVSKAFPAGPHQTYSGLNAIDSHALTAWATENGWDAQADPESTHLDQQSIPWIKFTKK